MRAILNRYKPRVHTRQHAISRPKVRILVGVIDPLCDDSDLREETRINHSSLRFFITQGCDNPVLCDHSDLYDHSDLCDHSYLHGNQSDQSIDSGLCLVPRHFCSPLKFLRCGRIRSGGVGVMLHMRRMRANIRKEHCVPLSTQQGQDKLNCHNQNTFCGSCTLGRTTRSHLKTTCT